MFDIINIFQIQSKAGNLIQSDNLYKYKKDYNLYLINIQTKRNINNPFNNYYVFGNIYGIPVLVPLDNLNSTFQNNKNIFNYLKKISKNIQYLNKIKKK